MDIRDFQGLTKYKTIIPIIYVISWVCMFTGPSLFPLVYQKAQIILVMYLTYKVASLFMIMTFVLVKSWAVIGRASQPALKNVYGTISELTEDINYAFIIPSYQEEVELIAETLEVLAAHPRAQDRYLIFLAMEEHENGSDLKAEKLIHDFRGKFYAMEYTRHKIRPNQQKGKASNVSWCAQNLQPIFSKYMIKPQTIMLTIIDADSWVPNLYMEELQTKINEEYEMRHQRIYQPTQIFTRNHLDVPVFTRVYDILHSFMHMSNLWSCLEMTYSLSNYTLSYNLVKRIGFWDTCADAIGEDYHTTIKSLWKTQMAVKTRPIYVPFNQVNICTGNGYCADVLARFWQGERHAKGVADIAYCFKMLLNQPFKFKNFVLFWFIFQTFAIAAIIPWMIISMNYQSNILYRFDRPSPELFSQQSLGYLFSCISTLTTLAYLMYEIVKRRANTHIYKQQNESIFRIFQYMIVFVLIFFAMSVPAFVVAAFSTLLGHQQYIVAEKKNTSKKEMS